MRRIITFGLALLIAFTLVVSFGFAGGQMEAPEKEGVAGLAPAKITIWIGYPEFEPIHDVAIADFEAANPGVKVAVTSYDLRESEKKIVMALAAGTAPDLFTLSEIAIIKGFISKGKIAKPPKACIDFIKESTPAWLYKVEEEAGLYGLPHQGGGGRRMYWNKDMFKEAGLSGAPTTWEENIEQSIKLAEYDANGMLIRSGISLRLSGGGAGLSHKFLIWLVNADSRVIEKVGEDKYRAGYVNQGGFDAVKHHLDILYKHKTDSHDIRHDAEAFALEETAMFMREGFVIGYMKEHAPNVDYGAAYLPRHTTSANVVSSDTFYMPETSENKDAAWAYALHYVQPKYQKMMLKETGWVPVNQKADYSDIVADTPQLESFITTPDYEDYHVIFPWSIENESAIHARFAERLEALFRRDDLVDNPEGIWQFLRDAAVETNDFIKDAGIYAGD